MALDGQGRLIEELTASNRPYIATEKNLNAQRVILVNKDGSLQNARSTVKDSWTGDGPGEKVYTSVMTFFGIKNVGTTTLNFSILGKVIEVDPGESFAEDFDPFNSVVVNATSKYKAYVKG